MADKATERNDAQDELGEPAKKTWRAPELKEFGINMTEAKPIYSPNEYTQIGPS